MKEFIEAFNKVQQEVHETAKDKGWWDEPRNDGELIALMHSELSEALEDIRKADPVGNLHLCEELADVIIRIMDYAQSRELNVGQAVIIKIERNKQRPHKHGGKRF